MSLIEVLVSVFVLTFGLMGIAMVIPAGSALMFAAAKSDRSSACGRAALNDIEIRGWHNPGGWQQYHAGNSLSVLRTDPVTRTSGVIYGDTFFVDPVFFQTGVAANTASVQFFPYTHEVVPALQHPLNRTWPGRALARRVTPSIPRLVADRITTWADDLIFSLEDDGARPRQMYTWTTGDSWAAPVLGGDDATVDVDGSLPDDYPVLATNDARYTWAATITPNVPGSNYSFVWPDPDLGTMGYPVVDLNSISQYEVSVVVFYNRNFYCPTPTEIQDSVNAELIRERCVYAEITDGGLGGGTVQLFVKGDGSGTTHAYNNPPAGYLDVNKNDWIMLKALDRSRQISYSYSGNAYTYRPTVCKWYRVVAVDTVQDGAQITDPTNLGGPPLEGRGRYVTLAGPDWQVDTTFDTTTTPQNYPAFNSTTDIAEAVIVSDVAGVYTTVIDATAL